MAITLQTTASYGRSAPLVFLAVLAAILLLSLQSAVGEPTGATISDDDTDTGPVYPPDSITTERGTVTTMLLNVIQQNQHWKAYVGNVSGVLTLDDSDTNTIYEWDMTGLDFTGRVYAMHVNSIDTSFVNCSNDGNVTAEEIFFNMTATDVDNINRTFNYTIHDSFFVGTNKIESSYNCQSLFTFINNISQAGVDEDSPFQEILLQDGADNIIYTTLLVSDEIGYNNETYDFQMIVPESHINIVPTTYYFYMEIGS